MAAVAVAAVATGFSTTYFIPVARGTFAGPPVAHLHGLLFMTWIALLLVQPTLVRHGHSRLHRKLGLIALPLAVAVCTSAPRSNASIKPGSSARCASTRSSICE